MGYYSRWPRYVPVAKRRALAAKKLKSLAKKGYTASPVVIEGRIIAKTFWGRAWCDNLETYSDFENRLPRGRTYVRNGSVVDLQITKGKIEADVIGSSLYHVTIAIEPMIESKWKALVKACAGKIDSLIELLQGKFSKAVMEIIAQKEGGLFPKPQEIAMSCSCPDYAGMCKHIAAVLYGVGASLDTQPERLFALRHVNHVELLASASSSALAQEVKGTPTFEESALSTLFGIEMDMGKEAVSVKTPKTPSKTAKEYTVEAEEVIVICIENAPLRKHRSVAKKK